LLTDGVIIIRQKIPCESIERIKMKSKTAFHRLSEPYHIGSVKIRNRIIKSGAGMFFWHEDELHMNAKMKAFYEAIARGGVGLLVVESPTIDYPAGARWRQRYRIDDDKYIPGLKELTDIIHQYGCPTFMQMNHDGPWQTKLWDPVPVFEGPPIAASPVCLFSPMDSNNEMPRELTIPEIKEIVNKFASAAVRAQKAGFDGVDINAGSSHLLHTFLSPYWNKRQDTYGGSIENRARIVVEIIQEIKRRLSGNFPVTVLINGIEIGQTINVNDNECLTAEDGRQIALALEKAGADAIQVRNHWLGYHLGGFLPDQLFYPEAPIPLKSFPKEYYLKGRGRGANIILTEALKKILSIPIIAVGRIDAEMGERIIREGKADFIAMNRNLIADPDYPKKNFSGNLRDVAPCTACCTCLGTGRCRINAALGTEFNTIGTVTRKKRVMVIGGGPAGMEAARVASLRGHEVILFEKARRLGGLMPLAALVKGLEIEDLVSLNRYLASQIKKLGVITKLGKEVNSTIIKEIKPDVVILATGTNLVAPEIDGIEGKNIVSSTALHHHAKPLLNILGPRMLRWLTRFWLPIGRKVIIIGSGMQGCELAEFLIKRGRNVTIIDKANTPGEGIVGPLQVYFFSWLSKKGATIISGVKSMTITGTGLTYISNENLKRTLEADTILPVSPLKPNIALLEEIKGLVPEIYTIGDCREPRMIVDAVSDAWQTARNI
jgi:2,4-dienoyl-CoA reductase (NADPH2)